jgi:dienelactone hydrolase
MAAAGEGDDEWAGQAALFEYDTSAGFALKELGVEKRDGASVRDISFVAVPGKEPVKAYLVVPEGKGPFAGVLWVHWLGDPKTTNRTQYLGEAVTLASRGVLSLLVDGMWSAPDWYGKRVLEEDFDNSIKQVVALRRAMDLLVAQPGVDKDRLGFVGHDYGGMYGMMMAGLDQRARTYVYVAVTQSLNDWAFFARQPRSKIAYLRQNAPLELTDYLRRVKNASTLLQFAAKDEFVSQADAMVLHNTAAAPKEKKVYEADHAMEVPQAAADRQAWLLEKLATPSPAARTP